MRRIRKNKKEREKKTREKKTYMLQFPPELSVACEM